MPDSGVVSPTWIKAHTDKDLPLQITARRKDSGTWSQQKQNVFVSIGLYPRRWLGGESKRFLTLTSNHIIMINQHPKGAVFCTKGFVSKTLTFRKNKEIFNFQFSIQRDKQGGHECHVSRVSLTKSECDKPHKYICLYYLWAENTPRNPKSLMTFMTHDIHDTQILV